MEKVFDQNLKHCKRVKLQNFQTFKIKDNCQILFKPKTAAKLNANSASNLDSSPNKKQNNDNENSVVKSNINATTLNGIYQSNKEKNVDTIRSPTRLECNSLEISPMTAQNSADELIHVPKKRRFCDSFNENVATKSKTSPSNEFKKEISVQEADDNTNPIFSPKKDSCINIVENTKTEFCNYENVNVQLIRKTDHVNIQPKQNSTLASSVDMFSFVDDPIQSQSTQIKNSADTSTFLEAIQKSPDKPCEFQNSETNFFKTEDLFDIKNKEENNSVSNITSNSPESNAAKQHHIKPILPTKKWCNDWLESHPKTEIKTATDISSLNTSFENSSASVKQTMQNNGLLTSVEHGTSGSILNTGLKTTFIRKGLNEYQLKNENSTCVKKELLNDQCKNEEMFKHLKDNKLEPKLLEPEQIQGFNKTLNEIKNNMIFNNEEISEKKIIPNENLDHTSIKSQVVNNVEMTKENSNQVNTMAENEVNSDVNNSDESSTDNNEVRRSTRIKTILEKTKPRVFMRSTSNKSPDSDNNKINEENLLVNQVSVEEKSSSSELSKNEELPTELPKFELIDENIYLGKNKKSRICKEIRHMKCECYNMAEDDATPCGNDCLNRLLMIECTSRCLFKEHCTNKRFQRKEFSPTQVFQTTWKGWGLQATSDLTPGQFLMEYCGEVLDPFEFYKRSQIYAEESQQHFYFMALSQNEVVDATLKGNTSRFINHSCDPNCETQKWTVNGRLRVGFFAKRNVSAGEEITFDYQFERYGKEAQKCFCGSDKCRGYLGKPPNENDDDEDLLKILPTNLLTSLPVELDKKEKKKGKKWQEFVNNTLEHEINCFMSGLQTTKEVLMLSRFMVRSETVEQRLLCLNVLTNTSITSCLREFLKFHGLSLIWSWMVDLTSSTKILETEIQLKIQILNTLKILPITNKNILEDSKVLVMVQRWLKEETENSENLFEEITKLKQQVNSNDENSGENENVDETMNEFKNENADEANLEENTSKIETEQKTEVVAEDLKQILTEEEANLEVATNNKTMLIYLLDLWKDLKEVYRIPKRIITSHKLSENTDQDYDDLSSVNDSPIAKEDENIKPNLKQTSYYGHRNRKEYLKESEKERIKRSPDTQDGKIKPNTDGDNLKWLYNSESSSKISRQEHRRQFERNQDNNKKTSSTSKDFYNIQTLSTPQISQSPETPVEPTTLNYIPQPTTYIPQNNNIQTAQIYPSMYEINPQESQVVYPTVQEQVYQDLTYTGGLAQQTIQTTYDSVNGVMYTQPIPVVGAQQPIQQNGVTILGSQSGQAIVLLSQEQLQQLTNQQPIGQQQQLVYPPIQTNLTQFQQIQNNQVPITTELQPTLSKQPVPDKQHKTNTVKKSEKPKDKTPKDPRSMRLPPNWKTATDAEGSVYYYHTITRKTQWEPPTFNRFENLDTNSSDSSSVVEPTKQRDKKSGEKSSKLQESDDAKKYREAFRKKMSQQIVSCLSAYRRPDCKIGRITSTEDFKHLARKITHDILMKEIKQVQVWEDLEVNSNVKHKAKDYVRKYMSKMGAVYKVKDHKD